MAQMKIPRRTPNTKLIAAAATLFALTAQAAINVEELPVIESPAQSVQTAKPAISPLSALTLCGIKPGDSYPSVEKVLRLKPTTMCFGWTGYTFGLSPLPAGLTLATMPVKEIRVNMFAAPSHNYVPAQFCSISSVVIECRMDSSPDSEMLGKGLLQSLAAQIGEPTNKEARTDWTHGFIFTWGKAADGLQLVVDGYAEQGYFDKINRGKVTFTLKNDGLVSAIVKKNDDAKRKSDLMEKYNQRVPVFNAPVK